MSVNHSADPPPYSPATPIQTAQFSPQSDFHGDALQRRMGKILDDWERCQENSSSESDSNNDSAIDAANSPASDARDDSQAECSGEYIITCHGDAPRSGASESSTINCRGSRDALQISRNSLLGQAGQSTQATEDDDNVCIGEGQIADDQDDRKAKLIPCPIKDCPGKEPSISKLL